VHPSLFSRLTLGYLVIFAIVAAASSYAILELTDFSNQAESILRIDSRVLDHEKFLTDLLLAQSRAEQKFVISRDETWYLQFVRLKIDFEARAESAAAVADGLAQATVRRVREFYRRYVDLVDDEARWVRTKKDYPQARFKQDKDKLVDAMLDELERLRVNQQLTTYSKVQELAASAAQSAASRVVDRRGFLAGDRSDVAFDHQEHYAAVGRAQSQDPRNSERQFRSSGSDQIASRDRRIGGGS
jgi:hypothetical protein